MLRGGRKFLTGIAVGTCGLHDEWSDNRTHLINMQSVNIRLQGKQYSHIEKYIKEHGMGLMLEL